MLRAAVTTQLSCSWRNKATLCLRYRRDGVNQPVRDRSLEWFSAPTSRCAPGPLTGAVLQFGYEAR
jgi:hypothetical protein